MYVLISEPVCIFRPTGTWHLIISVKPSHLTRSQTGVSRGQVFLQPDRGRQILELGI